jgi:CRISPR-associated protein Cas2
MILWILYDIENDRARTKVATACKQAGLHRVQYSCFLGEIEADMRDTLGLKIRALIDEDKDKVYLFAMNQTQLQQCQMLGQAFDKKLITDQIKVLFL